MGMSSYVLDKDDEFIDVELPYICVNSDSLNEAIIKAKELRNREYTHTCSEEQLVECMPDIWNTVWEKYN